MNHVNWEAPYLDYEDIRAEAERFLGQYNPQRSIPVPIEDIFEFELGVSYLLLPGIKSVHGVDSYLESDRKTLCVDESIFHFKPRFRFSVAHEIGHLILHNEFYQMADFKTTEEYVTFKKRLNPKDEYWLERHANNFAGLVLVPGDELKKHFEEGIKKAISEGVDPYNVPGPFLDYVSPWLSRKFEVNEQVIKIRIDHDRLW